MKRLQTTVLIAVTLWASAADAADRSKIRALNVGLQPIFTLASAAIQGKLRSRADLVRCVRSGVVAGYGFYKSKEITGNGHVRSGLVMANIAASLSRNAAAGRFELSRLGASIGPLRFDISTPFEEKSSALLHVQGSVSEGVALALMWNRSSHIGLRDGRISFRRKSTYDADGRQFTGYTIGMFSGTTYDATATTWHHESIHGIQSIQADSVEPPACAWFRARCDEPVARHGIAWEPWQLGVLPAVGGGALSLQDYTNRWTEIEATWLAEKRAPR
jgi:hypothetical protein